jgi:GTP pyrophosphokinase
LPGVPPGIMVEVQIRTPEMHREANIGVAAHWSYKEAGKHRQDRSRVLVERALVPESDDDGPRMSDIVDHMFVLTPKGDVVELPEGATPLDFAFQVHTAVGLSFKAARVNGFVVPLDHRLENGDIVEIVRHKDPKPSPRWISLLKTASARNRLKRHLAVQDRPRLLDDGRNALNRELKRLRHAPLDAQLTLLRSLDGKVATLLEREDLLVAIGQGSISSAAALLKIDDLIVKKEEPVRVRQADGVPRAPRVEGSIPMPVKLAKCCKPEGAEGHPIVGIIGRSGDVRIHRTDCKMLRSANPERRIHAHWAAPVTRAAKR